MGLGVGVDVDIDKVSLLLEQAFEKLTENILSIVGCTYSGYSSGPAYILCIPLNKRALLRKQGSFI